jgi:esterase/lipase superfamily enzyme
VYARQPIKPLGFILLLSLFVFGCGLAAQAQDAVPAPQVLAQANAKQTQAELNLLNRRISALRRSGKAAAAIPLAQRAVRLTEQRYGRNNLRTATALTTLADLMISEKRYAAAEPLLQRALTIQRRGKAPTATVARTYERLASLADKRGRRSDADKYRARANIMRGKKSPKKQAQKSFKYKPPASGAPNLEATRRVEQQKLEAAKRQIAEAQARRQLEAKQHAPAAQQGQAERRRSRSLQAKPRVGASRGGERAPAAPSIASEGGSSETARTMARETAPGGGESAGGAPVPESSSDGVTAGPPAAWDVVPVFYGTDRAEEPSPERVAYNSDRARRLELGRALVTVPKVHEVPQVERPWAIRIPYFDVTIWEETEDRNKHFTMQEIKKLSKDQFLQLVRQRLGRSNRFKDHALVFVHGYNTSFDNAVYRTAQIAYDLKFDGAPFLYSWPSGGAIASYTYDRANADASKPYMREFLELVVKETGAKSISIIAHSMGNQPLMSVLKDMKSSTPDDVVISQVILAAPDVDLDTFADLASSIKGLARGVTLYAASNDRALMASRNFWGYYRAGDVPVGGPVVLPGVDTIDVTAASTDTFSINHSGYAQKNRLLRDIRELILTGLRPPDQRELHPSRVATEKGDYWQYTGQSD